MSEPFIGEIRMTSWNIVPKFWALCNGQLLPIAQNQALFALLGTMYGGDGQNTFGLPDLRGRVPLSFGANPQGSAGGEEAHMLTVGEMAAHTHSVIGSNATADAGVPENAFWAARTGQSPYAGTADQAMWVGAINPVGGSQAHENMQPYLTISFMIALAGIWPSRD